MDRASLLTLLLQRFRHSMLVISGCVTLMGLCDHTDWPGKTFALAVLLIQLSPVLARCASAGAAGPPGVAVNDVRSGTDAAEHMTFDVKW